MDATSWFHLDPINLLVVVVVAIGGWFTLKNTTTWHTAWIRKHDVECDEIRKGQAKIMTELQVSNAHLSTMVEAIDHRLTRIENTKDAAVRGVGR